MAPTLTANRTASACLHILAGRCGAIQWIVRTARYAYAAIGIGRSNVTIQATGEVGTSGYSRPNQITSPMRRDAAHLISVGRNHSGGKRSCIQRSNNEAERRGIAPTTNEADLSQSSTPSLAQRSCGPRSLQPIVRCLRQVCRQPLHHQNRRRSSCLLGLGRH
jgi:hypothetical protein